MSFGLTKNKNKIEDYKFMSFDKTLKDNLDSEEVVNYEFLSLDNVKDDIRKKEKDMVEFITQKSRDNGFNISPIVREHKGFRDRDQQEREDRIAEEIEKRFNRIKEQGYEQGYKEGFEEGKKEVYDQTRMASEEKLDALSNMISETLNTQEGLLVNQKKQVYYLIRNLTKWIILRELKNDGAYLERLLERLISEMSAKKNLLIRANKNDFERMPDVLEVFEKKMGELDNVRVEVDYETSKNGIILECDNGIINGTFDEQFKNLDKLFHTVGINDEFFKDNKIVEDESSVDIEKLTDADK